MKNKTVIDPSKDSDTHSLRFSDAFADVFTFPEDLAPTKQESMFVVFMRDRQRMRECFEDALMDLGLKKRIS